MTANLSERERLRERVEKLDEQIARVCESIVKLHSRHVDIEGLKQTLRLLLETR